MLTQGPKKAGARALSCCCISPLNPKPNLAVRVHGKIVLRGITPPPHHIDRSIHLSPVLPSVRTSRLDRGGFCESSGVDILEIGFVSSPVPPSFLLSFFRSVWHQASWAWVVSLPITLANFSKARGAPMGPAGWACIGLAAAGLAIETVADYQVRRTLVSNRFEHMVQTEESFQEISSYLSRLTVVGSSPFFLLDATNLRTAVACCWDERSCFHPTTTTTSTSTTEIRVQEQPGQQGQVHGLWSLGFVSTPQLPRRDGGVVGLARRRPSYAQVSSIFLFYLSIDLSLSLVSIQALYRAT